MVSNWILTDNKYPKVSRTLLSILANLNNVIIWMVFTFPLIYKFSCLCTNPFGIVPSAPITIGVTVTFMFHSCFFSLILKQGQDIRLSLRFLLISLCCLPGRQSSQFAKFSLFYLFIYLFIFIYFFFF